MNKNIVEYDVVEIARQFWTERSRQTATNAVTLDHLGYIDTLLGVGGLESPDDATIAFTATVTQQEGKERHYDELDGIQFFLSNDDTQEQISGINESSFPQETARGVTVTKVQWRASPTSGKYTACALVPKKRSSRKKKEKK